MDDAAQDALLQHRFLLMTGKGGVGKTTVAASLAVHAARSGHRPLIVELGHRQSMRSVFAVDDIGFAPRDVGHGVHAMSVDVDVAVLDYMVEHLPSKRLAKGIVKNRVLERLFKAMPAVGEIATVNKLKQLEAARFEGPGGGPQWGPIIVDLDATGHALMFLELRSVLENIMGGGPMRSLVEEVAAMLADPAISRLNIVTTPDELPVTETTELFGKLQTSRSVAFGRVFVNRTPAVDLGDDGPSKLDALEAAARAAGRDDVIADVAFGRQALRAQVAARAQIDRLRAAVSMPICELPLLDADRMDPDTLDQLGTLACAPITDGGTR